MSEESNCKPGGVAVTMEASFFGFYAHGGFLAGLDAGGVAVARVAGASAGGLTACLAATGMGSDGLREFLFADGFRWQWFEWSILWRMPGVMLNVPGCSGVVRGDKMVAYLRSKLGPLRLEDCPGPKAAVSVTNVGRGRPETKEAGEIAELAVASCAVPGLFAHRVVGGERYWDGGVAEPAPMLQWLDDDGVETVIVHLLVRGEALGSGGSAPRRWSVGESFAGLHEMVAREVLAARYRDMRAAGKRVIPVVTRVPAIRFLHRTATAEECWRCGYEAGQQVAGDLAGEKAGTSAAPPE